MNVTILDHMPLWGLFVLTVAVVMLAVEAGYLIGRRHQGQHLEISPINTMVGASLGLLAFMLAFTFGMAGGRFEKRKELVIDDANAIRTAYLRTDLLDESDRGALRKLLLEYVDIRIEASLHPEKGGLESPSLARTEQIQNELWSIVTRISHRQPNSDSVQLQIQALNGVFDTHSKRVMIAYTNRIPGTIWLVLYSLLFFSMTAVGYYSGITVSRSRLIAITLALAFSAILVLIGDLDRPEQGFLKVNQQALIGLRNKMDIDARTVPENAVKSAVDKTQLPDKAGQSR